MTPNRSVSETFSSVDAAWLHMDSPTNLAIITGVMTFRGRLNEDRLRNVIVERFLKFDRFRQRVVEPAFGIGLPRWEDDPEFSIHNHLVRVTLPEPYDHTALQQFVGDLMGQPLDRDLPLWKFFLADMADGGSALICRLHHCIADGMALVQVLLSTADVHPEGDTPPEEVFPIDSEQNGWLEQLVKPALHAARRVGKGVQAVSDLAQDGLHMLTHPGRIGRAAAFGVSATRSLGKLLFIPPDHKTSLRGKCGMEKRAAWSVAINLEEVKGIGRLMGGTINDVLISALTGALRRYLELRGDGVDGLNIRSVVPVSLRPNDDLDRMGNQFGLIFLSLPVGVRDPLKRLATLKRRMNDIKGSPEALVAFGILGGMGLTPTQIEHIILAIFAMKGTGVVTNVPGPRYPLYYAGELIDTLMFWVPTPGNLGLGVSIISYNGKVIMGVATDAGLAPDPENILASFAEELDYLKRWGRPPLREAGKPVVTEISQTMPAAPVDGETIIAPNGHEPPTAAKMDEESFRCQATTRAGEQCKNRAMPGQTWCHAHRNRHSEKIFE